jgi:two-component system phosphate regulon sensor histidine kinase PhoR
MRLSLRWKISLAFTLLTAVLFGLLWAYLRSAVIRHTTESVREGLRAQTYLAAEALPQPPWTPSPELQRLVRELDHRSGARVTLIDERGTVMGDSRHDPVTMENHADRPERLQALGQGWGSELRYSNTLRIDMLYVAVASPGSAAQRPVVRLALPLTAVRQASTELRHALVAAFFITVAVVWLLSVWLAGTLTAPVRRLVDVARRIARGDLQARVQQPASGEVGELTDVFNASVERLSELLESSERQARHYAAILQQMSDAVVVVDERERVQFINATFARIFGADPEQVGERYLAQIARNYELSVLLTRSMEQRAAQRGEVRISYPETRILAAVATPLTGAEDESIGAVALLHDVTEMRRMDEVRRDFVANASHELRTPVAGIKALAEAMQAGALQDAEKGPQFLRQIVEAADRLTLLLDDMLTLTSVERGQEFLRPRELDAAGALAQATAHVEPAAMAKGVALATRVSPGEKLYADPDSLQTVLINLLDNAVRHTPSDGEVTLSGRRVADGYEISVTDTGVGISEEHIPRIFERFYRVDRDRSRGGGGTGLGLSIVKHIAEAHGGRVGVRSTPGQGCTFSVFFPAEQVHAQ